jgi:hypothetical protein
MQTVREQAKLIDISHSGYNDSLSQIPDPSNQIKKLKISEFISWSVCFSVICLLTGLLIYFQLGVTMESVTYALFFLSLAGLIYYISKIITLSKVPVSSPGKPLHLDGKPLHGLN